MAEVGPTPRRWAILWVRLDPVEGHEQAGQRPVLVVSFEPFHRLGLLTVLPITSARTTPRIPGDVAVPAGQGGLTLPSVIICSQLRTISVARVLSGRRGTPVGPAYLQSETIRQQVREAMAHHLGLDMRAPADGASGEGYFVENP
ncbi:MAG TPA: type II toxin-antitoxin system PemK/MazF family toxin [Chloroflexota bacterium]